MTAPATFTDAPFTRAQAQAVIETAKRLAAAPHRKRAAMFPLAGVSSAAVRAIDNLDGHEGFEDAHTELQAELEAVDLFELWQATATPERFLREEPDRFVTPRVAGRVA